MMKKSSLNIIFNNYKTAKRFKENFLLILKLIRTVKLSFKLIPVLKKMLYLENC